MFVMNFDPQNYSYEVVPAEGLPGVDLLVTLKRAYEEPENRFEEAGETVPPEGMVKNFYLANQTVDSLGLHSHMASMTDTLLLDFFVKAPKRKKKKAGR